jgi:hypothetical protein
MSRARWALFLTLAALTPAAAQAQFGRPGSPYGPAVGRPYLPGLPPARDPLSPTFAEPPGLPGTLPGRDPFPGAGLPATPAAGGWPPSPFARDRTRPPGLPWATPGALPAADPVYDPRFAFGPHDPAEDPRFKAPDFKNAPPPVFVHAPPQIDFKDLHLDHKDLHLDHTPSSSWLPWGGGGLVAVVLGLFRVLAHCGRVRSRDDQK